MNPSWHRFLATQGAQFSAAADSVAHFGDAAAELARAGSATVVVPLTHLGLIAADGEDTKAFLHGQLTSDVNHLAIGRSQLSAWCSAKGRMLASFLVTRTAPEGYRLLLAADLQGAIEKRLAMFVLRARVKIASLADSHVHLGLAGPAAGAALAAAGLPVPADIMETALAGERAVLRLDDSRYLISLPLAEAEASWPALAAHAVPAGLPTWQWLDVAHAFPLITLATKEEFVPQMADFEKMGGVSFHKGCYPGQEIVARTQYLGKVKRHLYRLKAGHTLDVGADLHSPEHPEQAVGKIMTAAPSPEGGYTALAVVQANYASSLHLAAVDGPTVEAFAVNP